MRRQLSAPPPSRKPLPALPVAPERVQTRTRRGQRVDTRRPHFEDAETQPHKGSSNRNLEDPNLVSTQQTYPDKVKQTGHQS